MYTHILLIRRMLTRDLFAIANLLVELSRSRHTKLTDRQTNKQTEGRTDKCTKHTAKHACCTGI